MLDEMLQQVKAAEEEAKKIAARGNKEAERILRKVNELKDIETQKAVEEVKKLMADLEVIKLDEAKTSADSIKEAARREVEEIKESVQPKVKRVTQEIKDVISKG